MMAIDILSSGDVAGAATGVEEEDVGVALTPAPTNSWFVLGDRQDLVLEIESGVVRITSASVPDKLVRLTTKRCARLTSIREKIDDVVREIKLHRRRLLYIFPQFPMSYFAHIGDTYYVTVTAEYGCVDIRRFYVPYWHCLLYTSPSPRDRQKSRMPSSA